MMGEIIEEGSEHDAEVDDLILQTPSLMQAELDR